MLAKILTIQPNASFCYLKEAKVINCDPVKELTSAYAKKLV